jgi:sulfur carrier protein
MPEPLCTHHGCARFNGAEIACPPGLTVAALLADQGVNPTAVATALNGAFIAREQRGHTVLKAGDEVLTFQAIVGG